MDKSAGWVVECTACEFCGRASTEETAERLAEIHRTPTDHELRIRAAGDDYDR